MNLSHFFDGSIPRSFALIAQRLANCGTVKARAFVNVVQIRVNGAIAYISTSALTGQQFVRKFVKAIHD
jgi:hypothetical protein